MDLKNAFCITCPHVSSPPQEFLSSLKLKIAQKYASFWNQATTSRQKWRVIMDSLGWEVQVQTLVESDQRL